LGPLAQNIAPCERATIGWKFSKVRAWLLVSSGERKLKRQPLARLFFILFL